MNTKELSEALSQLGHMYGDKAEVVVEYFGEFYKVSGLTEIVVGNRLTGRLSSQIQLLLTPVNIQEPPTRVSLTPLKMKTRTSAKN